MKKNHSAERIILQARFSHAFDTNDSNLWLQFGSTALAVGKVLKYVFVHRKLNLVQDDMGG